MIETRRLKNVIIFIQTIKKILFAKYKKVRWVAIFAKRSIVDV